VMVDTLHTLTQPVLARAVDAARRTITGADLTPAEVGGVFCVGGGARLPQAAQALQDGLGVPVTVVPDPDTPALLVAADAAGTPAGPPAPVLPAGRPGPRQFIAAAVPAAAAVVMLGQAITTALPVQIAGIFSPVVSVIANWGEYAMIGVAAT